MPANLADLMQAAGRALNAGRWDELRHHAEALLQQDPAHAEGWFFLSLVAANQGQLAQALALVERALILQPDHVDYLVQKARWHVQRHEHADALKIADRALALQPQRALLLDTLGVIYSRLGEHHKAASVLAAAVDKAPDNPQFRFNLGSARHFLGHMDAAASCYRQALALRPDFCRAWWALAELGKGTAAHETRAEGGGAQPRPSGTSTVDEKADQTYRRSAPDVATDLQQMLDLRARPGLSVPDALYLGHALARAYERQGNYCAAFQALEQGKEPRRFQAALARRHDEQVCEALLAAFPANAPQAMLPASVPQAADQRGAHCLFIVGMPRSGTTLLERMLAAHSQIHSLGELQDFPLAVKKASGSGSPQLLDPETITGALQAAPASIAAHYLDALRARTTPGLYCIDKLPLNFLQIGFIRRALPGAKILCIRRNPLDTIVANYRQLFALDHPWFDYHYSLEETTHFFLRHTRLLAHWQQCCGERLHVMDYEALVATPEAVLRRALDYLGLQWEPACLDFHNNPDAVTTASSMQVREPLHGTAIGRWRHYREALPSVVDILRAGGVACEEYDVHG